jgi:hypothetical protein
VVIEPPPSMDYQDSRPLLGSRGIPGQEAGKMHIAIAVINGLHGHDR